MGFSRNIFFKTLYHSGAGKLLLNYNRKHNLVPVLVFHKIIPEYDNVWPGIHPKLFEETIKMLKKHYTILPLYELYYNTNPQLNNACFITFDDGYKDYLDYAYPILKKHKAHSTLFVLPYDITNKGHIWTSTIIFFIKRSSFEDVESFFNAFNLNVNYSDKTSAFHINLDVTRELCKLNHRERNIIIDALREKLVEDNRIMENELLSFEELKKLDNEFVSLASHSLTHPSFLEEDDDVFIEKEVGDSKRIIENELKKEVYSFAFPFAKFNSLSLNIVKKHYKLCFTGIDNSVDLNQINRDKGSLFNLPRFNVHHDTAEEVFFLINGFHKKFRR